ncbi:MAG: hypothetical protein INR71_04710 [Terriglobus roseus]|nr:hypothetical protein [Terriglobus roseus]
MVPALLVVLVSMTSKLDIGVRHVLPVYPFAAALAGATAYLIARRSKLATVAIAAVLLFQFVSSVHAYPDYLPYANEAFGGSDHTYRLLSDSNVDWGQQMKEASAYLQRKHVTDCWSAYSQAMPQPIGYGVPCKLLPSGLGMWAQQPQTIVPTKISGIFLLGAFETSGASWGPGGMNPYQQFQDGHPNDVVGHSILVYEGTYDTPLLAAQSHFSQVPTLIRRGQIALAMQEANTAVEIEPNAADIQVELGAMYRTLQQPAQADAAFTRALALAKAHRPDDQTETIAQRIDAIKRGRY